MFSYFLVSLALHGLCSLVRTLAKAGWIVSRVAAVKLFLSLSFSILKKSFANDILTLFGVSTSACTEVACGVAVAAMSFITPLQTAAGAK